MRWQSRVQMVVVCAGLAPCIMSGPAYAQDGTDASEEIIVRAARLAPAREQILQGAAVLERADVIEQLGQGLGDTLDGTPGVSSTAFGAGASRPIIRGLGEDRVRVLTNNLAQIDASTVSPDHAVSSEGLEAERIEILRGPVSLAYGGNAIGGVVNVVDGVIAEALPEKAISGHAYGAYALGLRASEGAGHIEAAVGPLVVNAQGFRRASETYSIRGFAFSEPLRARLLAQAAANGEPAPDFAQSRAPNTQSSASSYNFGLALVGKVLGQSGFAGLSFKRVTSAYGIPEAPGLEEEGGGEATLFPGPFIDLASNRYEGKAGLRDVGPFSELRASLAVVNYGHTEFEPSGEAGTRFTNQGVNARFEASHKSIFGLRGLAGFEALSTDFAAEGAEAFITPSQTRDFAGFLIERYARGPLSIEGGFRYGNLRVRNVTAGERDFSLVNLSLGAGYQASEALFFSLNITRSQRAPTQTELFSQGPHLATASFERGDPGLTKERGLAIEGGARLRQGRFTLEANGYTHGFDGFVALTANGEEEDGLPVFVYTQRDARFVGGEISGKAELINAGEVKLSVDAAIDLVRANFRAGGDALPRIPPMSTQVGLDGNAGPLKLRLEWERAGRQDRAANFESPTPGFNLFNARLSFKPIKSGPLNLLIDARNLTDEDVRVHTSFVKDLLPRPGRSIRFAANIDF